MELFLVKYRQQGKVDTAPCCHAFVQAENEKAAECKWLTLILKCIYFWKS